MRVIPPPATLAALSSARSRTRPGVRTGNWRRPPARRARSPARRATPAMVTISEIVPMSWISPARSSSVRVAAIGRKKAR